MKYWLGLLLITGSLFGISQPEGGSGWVAKEPVYAKRMMVSSANRHASEEGLAILEQGGNALDAAIAMQMVLNVVEPQSSGLGGGAFLLYYKKDEEKVFAYNGRETAPAAVKQDFFLDAKGRPLPMGELIRSGASVGVPGLLRTLEQAHEEQGKLPWKTLFTSAIELADQGFPVSPRLKKSLAKTPMVDTLTIEEGRVINQPLAKTLQIIAEQGSAPFYTGEIAQDIATRVQEAGGVMTRDDLELYRPLKPPPLVTEYHGYRLMGLPVESCCGGDVVSTILKGLRDAKGKGLGDLAFIKQFCDASHRAYVQWYPYLSSLSSTSQLCVVDGEGNAVSMTSSIENAFGSTLMVDGFFLNNTLTDFSFSEKVNQVGPGRRPFSAMSPTLVFEGENLRLAVGSAGGLRIVDYVTQVLCGVLNFGLNIQEAIDFPHYASLTKLIELEKGTFLEKFVPNLETEGYQVELKAMTSGTQGIQITPTGLIGGADPRREGVALGK